MIKDKITPELKSRFKLASIQPKILGNSKDSQKTPVSRVQKITLINPFKKQIKVEKDMMLLQNERR